MSIVESAARARTLLTTAPLILTVLLGVASCSSSSSGPQQTSTSVPRSPSAGAAEVTLAMARYADLPGWASDQQATALAALKRSCPKLTALRPDQQMGSKTVFGRAAHWQKICGAAYLTSGDDRRARKFFEEWFVPYHVWNGGEDHGLFTGYYEPLLHGSWRRTGRYTAPIYRLPQQLAAAGQTVNGHAATLPTRAEIDAGALANRSLEILWLDDPIDAFFLHIQGSGQVEMADGSRVRIGFAGKNGHPYVSIGAELIRRGEIAREDMSMQAIRTWMAAHPAQAPRLMAMNPSFVFFRVIDGDGPIGAQGVALVPGRSIAVDPGFVPYGVPLWLDTTDPLAEGEPLRRLVIAQDTGGAIRGPVRGDLFWGSGEAAGVGAGLMKQEGRWFMLLPKAASALS
jgi:peptidoglycan lytic transglycosylase A